MNQSEVIPPTSPHSTAAERLSEDQNLFWTKAKVSPTARASRNGHPGCVVWLTGLSAAGKSTLAVELERSLFAEGKQVYVLDGDNLRHGLCRDLGFSPKDRRENIRRVGEVAALLADAGLICITAFISPYRADREMARRSCCKSRFIEVFVNAPIEVCEQRDPKGLYKKARAGMIREFTGISAPYEAPLKADLEIRTDLMLREDCVRRIQQMITTSLPNLDQKS